MESLTSALTASSHRHPRIHLGPSSSHAITTLPLELVSGRRCSVSLPGIRIFTPHNHMSVRLALWPVSQTRNTQSYLPSPPLRARKWAAWHPSLGTKPGNSL